MLSTWIYSLHNFRLKFLEISVAAKIEIDSVQSNPIVVMRQSWIDDLAVTILQFPDFCFKA